MLFKMLCFLSRVWVLLFLGVLSIEDILEHQISMKWIGIFGITGFIYSIWTKHIPVFWLGILLLLFSYVTREQIGYGDGFLVLVLGMWMDMGQLCNMLFIASIISFLTVVCLKKRELPFVPFLTVGYIIGVLG